MNLKELVELHDVYNKHEGESLCIECGRIQNQWLLKAEEVEKYLFGRENSFEELLEHFCETNGKLFRFHFIFSELINIISKKINNEEKSALIRVMKKLKLKSENIIEEVLKNGLLGPNQLYEEKLIDQNNKRQVYKFWDIFKYKKEILKKYRINITNLTQIIKHSDWEELKLIELQKNLHYKIFINEYSKDFIEKLYFTKEKWKNIKFNINPEIFINLVKDGRFYLIEDTNLNKAIEIYQKIYGKWAWEDLGSLPTEKDREKVKGLKLKEINFVTENEHINKLIFFQDKFYSIFK